MIRWIARRGKALAGNVRAATTALTRLLPVPWSPRRKLAPQEATMGRRSQELSTATVNGLWFSCNGKVNVTALFELHILTVFVS
jgi:hypothetical protein